MNDAVLPVASRIDLSFDHGKGCWLYTASGEAYLDFASGIAVSSLGHSHSHLVRELKAQVGKLWHTSNTVRIPEGERLAQRMVDNSFAEVVFFANSGGEANEAAVKMARRFHTTFGRPDRYRIVTFEGAFHGRSLAMIAATGHPPYLDGFGPKVDGFDQVPFGDWAALEAVITPQTAAVMIEPIQGEGGLRVIPAEGLQRLRALCDERGLLLILDEVQSGVGRTGRFFAHEWSGITPDIATVAKGIGGGFPMGACLATRRAAVGMTLGSHGTTFGGNPLAMAAGNAVLDILLNDSFMERVERRGRELRGRLDELHRLYGDLIGEIRGEGLLQGFKAGIDAGQFVTALRNEGLIALAARDNVVRFAPPLIITGKEIINACTRIEAACKALRQGADSVLAAE
ncbi:aspartate aminotransferase family protein [Ochrobactrum vermis]|uniref:Acetylornithine aminotransferase n=1 Tax=Ochrobactrum vermis TaxID=1827297 RepID=A0ABU8PL27_9HYPH|nr:aspartate aminotransferase family protein [Ochrobactrum vermis]PQZ24316.1 acetylornithine transaminase [Ochrobactrum vermis]